MSSSPTTRAEASTKTRSPDINWIAVAACTLALVQLVCAFWLDEWTAVGAFTVGLGHVALARGRQQRRGDALAKVALLVGYGLATYVTAVLVADRLV